MSNIMIATITLIVVALIVGGVGVVTACSFVKESFGDGDFPTAMFHLLMAIILMALTLGAIVELTLIYEIEKASYEILKRTVFYE